MKFSILQEDLVTELTNLTRNTDSKFEVYSNIYIIKQDKNTIKLQATNGAISMEYKLPAKDVEGEEICINAHKFCDVISRLSGNITFDDGIIKCGKSKIKLDPIKKEKAFKCFVPIEAPTVELNTTVLKDNLKNRLSFFDY